MRLWPRREPPPDLDALALRVAQATLAEQRALQEEQAATTRAQLVEFQETLRAQGMGALTNGASPGVYARDHPFWWTQATSPRFRPRQIVTVETLREFAMRYDVLRAMINHLKNEVEQIPLVISARDEDDDSPATKRRVEEVTNWFEVEGGLGGVGVTRAEFERMVIEDLHVIGPAAIYLQPTRGGGVYEALAIDAATIRPRVDIFGWPGPGEDWYEQWVEGMLQRGFKPEEMYWKGLYPRTESPYPDSPCEYLVLTLLAAMSSDTWNREWLTNGDEPGRWISLPADMPVAVAREWLELFHERQSGNTRDRQKLNVFPGGTTQPQQNSRRDQDFQEFMMWMARRCAAIIGVQLAAIDLSQGKEFAVTQEQSMAQTSEVGVGKILKYFETFYNYLLRRNGYRDLVVCYQTAKEESALDKAERVMKLTGVPVWTPNRGLEELGDDALPAEIGDTLWVPTTYQPAEIALKPPEPAPAPGMAPESSGDRLARIARAEEAEGGHFVTIGGHPVFISDQGGSGGGKAGGTATAPASTRHGMHAASAEERKAFAIPPAWTDVHMADDPASALVAIGKDAKGRTQYRYSAAHADKQTVAKFERGRSFAGMLPSLRERIAKDAAGGGKNAEEAAALHLIAETGFRVGGSADTKAEKEAFGASTLRGEHVRVEGDTVHFDFTGKKGVRIQKSVTNRGLAQAIQGRIKEGERLFDTSDSKVRDYLHSIDGAFKVKDFRTWHGTAVALDAIQGMEAPGSVTAYKRARLEVGRRVADHLGNTPTVALSAYVDPHVFEPWRHRAGVTESD